MQLHSFELTAVTNKQNVLNAKSNKEIPLFNPRESDWAAHLVWSKDKTYIAAKTDIGQATIDLLELNRERILAIRLADIAVNRHPPTDDLTES